MDDCSVARPLDQGKGKRASPAIEKLSAVAFVMTMGEVLPKPQVRQSYPMSDGPLPVCRMGGEVSVKSLGGLTDGLSYS